MIDTLPKEDHDFILGFLRQQKADGVSNPMLASDVDLDNDGITDAFGLDGNEQLVFISGAKLAETTFKSDGDDIKAPDHG